MIEKIKTFSTTPLGHAVRWILLLPIALISLPVAKFLTNFILLFAGSQHGPETILGYIFRIVLSIGIGSFAYVYIGSLMAPKAKRIVSVILCTMLVMLNVLSYFFITWTSLITATETEISWQTYGESAILILGSIFGCMVVFSEFSEK